jgi:hypothetical protein
MESTPGQPPRNGRSSQFVASGTTRDGVTGTGVRYLDRMGQFWGLVIFVKFAKGLYSR